MDGTEQKHSSDKRVIRTKAAIQKALFTLMTQKDLSDITIIELAREANVNRRTFYTHYKNISEILDEIEDNFMDRVRAIIAALDMKKHHESVYKLFKGLDDLINGEFSYYFNVIHIDTQGFLMKRLKGIVNDVTKIHREKMLNRFGENAYVISEFIIGGFFSCYLEWYNDPDKTDAKFRHITEQVGNMVEGIVRHTSRNEL